MTEEMKRQRDHTDTVAVILAAAAGPFYLLQDMTSDDLNREYRAIRSKIVDDVKHGQNSTGELLAEDLDGDGYIDSMERLAILYRPAFPQDATSDLTSQHARQIGIDAYVAREQAANRSTATQSSSHRDRDPAPPSTVKSAADTNVTTTKQTSFGSVTTFNLNQNYDRDKQAGGSVDHTARTAARYSSTSTATASRLPGRIALPPWSPAMTASSTARPGRGWGMGFCSLMRG